MKKFIVIYLLSGLLPLVTVAQQEKQSLREGNKNYKSGNYSQSEKAYSEALGKKNNYYKANFNLGDAYYKQGKMTEASGQFDVFIKNNNNKDTLASAYHNLGNTFLKTKKYEEAIKAYRNALRFSPKDEDTRYNLAWAQKKLSEQKKDDQKKDKKDDKKNEQKKDKKDQENKNNQKKEEQQQQKKQPSQMTKEDAQRMLDQMKYKEQKLQNLRKQKSDKEAEKKKIEKDW